MALFSKICKTCGQTIVSKSNLKKYCCERCRKIAYKLGVNKKPIAYCKAIKSLVNNKYSDNENV